jgi:hypothetical protein
MSSLWGGNDAGVGSARGAGRYQILGMHRVSDLPSHAKSIVSDPAGQLAGSCFEGHFLPADFRAAPFWLFTGRLNC